MCLLCPLACGAGHAADDDDDDALASSVNDPDALLASITQSMVDAHQLTLGDTDLGLAADPEGQGLPPAGGTGGGGAGDVENLGSQVDQVLAAVQTELALIKPGDDDPAPGDPAATQADGADTPAAPSLPRNDHTAAPQESRASNTTIHAEIDALTKVLAGLAAEDPSRAALERTRHRLTLDLAEARRPPANPTALDAEVEQLMQSFKEDMAAGRHVQDRCNDSECGYFH